MTDISQPLLQVGRVLMIIASASMLVTACAGGDQQTTSTRAASVDQPTTTPATDSPSTTDQPADSTTTLATGADSGAISMIQTSFEPADIAVVAGTTVTWTNDDTIDHTTTGDDGAWDSQTLAPGETFERTFDEPGTYQYFCAIHPGTMRGTITVEG